MKLQSSYWLDCGLIWSPHLGEGITLRLTRAMMTGFGPSLYGPLHAAASWRGSWLSLGWVMSERMRESCPDRSHGLLKPWSPKRHPLLLLIIFSRNKSTCLSTHTVRGSQKDMNIVRGDHGEHLRSCLAQSVVCWEWEGEKVAQPSICLFGEWLQLLWRAPEIFFAHAHLYSG